MNGMITPECTENIEKFALLCADGIKSRTIRSVTLSGTRGEISKVRGVMKNIGEGVLQLEYFLSEGRVRQENVKPDDVGGRIAELIADGFTHADLCDAGGTATLLISKKGKCTLIRKGKIGDASCAPVLTEANDREKNYIFKGDEPFLIYLGISDKSGKVHDKRQSKFRQINRFVENIRDIMKYLPKNGTLTVADLCCGKSYLSFAAYHYLANMLGRSVAMTCIDLKQSVIDECADIARELHFDGMDFRCMDITKYKPDGALQLVISLHACDIATDIVLDCASSAGAEVILSTPCCHHQLNHIINCPTLDFITDHSMLRQKLCDSATDALRLLRLEAVGYDVSAIELIDPEETPKNIMLRAVKRRGFSMDSERAINKAARYRMAYSFLTGLDAPELPTLPGGEK